MTGGADVEGSKDGGNTLHRGGKLKACLGRGNCELQGTLEVEDMTRLSDDEVSATFAPASPALYI